MQITAAHLAEALQKEMWARWVAEQQVKLLMTENEQLKRAAESAATTPGADDAGDPTP